MPAKSYAKHVSAKKAKTPQNQPIPGTDQIKNDAGGYVFQIDDWKSLHRFLILGCDGGTYYASERKLTVENAKVVSRCLAEDGAKTVQTIVEISKQGRAAKNDAAIFALAMAASAPDNSTKKNAFAALPAVCRTGTHLFQFIEEAENLRGWGQGFKKAIQNWYLNKPLKQLAYQCLKYQNRNGWSHRDLLRLSHPASDDIERNKLFKYITKEELPTEYSEDIQLIEGVVQAKRLVESCKNGPATVDKQLMNIIRSYGLSHEMLPTEVKSMPQTWEALLPSLPLTALVRNLAQMTRLEVLKPLAKTTTNVITKLRDQEYIQESRLHPLNILTALKTYNAGIGFKGSNVWTPIPSVVDALDEAFYLSFQNAQKIKGNVLFGVDVSGSMSGRINSSTNLTCCVAAGAMSLVIANNCNDYHIHGFCDKFVNLNISKTMRLDDVAKRMQKNNFGGTDCALPMIYAQQNKLDVDAFVVITDNETWAGTIHPSQALRDYRKFSGKNAKLAVIGLTATKCSIADPQDPGMMDFVGFDTSLPTVLEDFINGNI